MGESPSSKAAPKTDPLIREMKKTYNASRQKDWDALVKTEQRWRRKLTIAQNKLGEVRNAMNNFTQELVKESDTGQKPQKPLPEPLQNPLCGGDTPIHPGSRYDTK